MTSDADAAQMAPTCEGCHSTSDPSTSTADGLSEVTTAFSTMGVPDTTSAEPQSQPAHQALDDDDLEQAWRDLGEPHEYEPPSERELQYLADSRRRSQGMRMQSQRLHRNNMKYIRHSHVRTASVPPTDAAPPTDAVPPTGAEPSVLAAAATAATAAAAAIASSPAPPADTDADAVASASSPAAVPAPPEDAEEDASMPAAPAEGGTSPPEDAPAEGSWARLIGLSKKPTLNGTLVRIGPWHGERERFEVRGGGQRLFVRPIRLRAVSAEEAATAARYVAATEAAIAADAQALACASRCNPRAALCLPPPSSTLSHTLCYPD
jgi:hypothetical protein